MPYLPDQTLNFGNGGIHLPIPAQKNGLQANLGIGEIRRLGENLPRYVDARIISATNKDIEDEIRKDGFREDLAGERRMDTKGGDNIKNQNLIHAGRLTLPAFFLLPQRKVSGILKPL